MLRPWSVAWSFSSSAFLRCRRLRWLRMSWEWGDQRRGESVLPGRRASRPGSGPRTTYGEDLQDKQEEEDFKAVFSRRRTTSRIPPQTLKGCFRASLLLRSNSSKACFLVKEHFKNTTFPD